jgi:O-antigen ligase
MNTNTKALWSAFFISLYLQGLSLYFYITGLLKIRASFITGLFLLGTPLTFLLISWGIKECRQKLLQFGFIEFLCLGFVILFFYDLANNPYYVRLPVNMGFMFATYYFAFFVARGLNFKQFKYVCYFTTFFALFSSLILGESFLSGTATSVANGSRLSVGDSGNPIEVGHLGSYAAAASLMMSLLAKRLPIKLLLLAAIIPATLVTMLSGTRSAVITLAISIVIILGTTIWINLKNSGSILKRLSVTAVIYYTVLLLGIGMLPFASGLTGGGGGEAGKSGFNLSGTLHRVSLILTLTEEKQEDDSINSRRTLYDQAAKSIVENPLTGTKLYSNSFVHNAFLQTTSEYGIMGTVTYAVPVLWLIGYLLNVARLGIKQGAPYFRTDAWMITMCMLLFSIQIIAIMCFHADPYRTYLVPPTIGMLIAFSRLGLQEKLQQIKPLKQIPMSTFSNS